MLANMFITAAYASINVAIVVLVARAGRLRANKLAVATSMIFCSCAVGTHVTQCKRDKYQ